MGDNFIPSLVQAVVDPLSPKLLSHSASQCIYKLYITIGATIFVARLPPSGYYHKELNIFSYSIAKPLRILRLPILFVIFRSLQWTIMEATSNNLKTFLS